jgi:hypothetical protein
MNPDHTNPSSPEGGAATRREFLGAAGALAVACAVGGEEAPRPAPFEPVKIPEWVRGVTRMAFLTLGEVPRAAKDGAEVVHTNLVWPYYPLRRDGGGLGPPEAKGLRDLVAACHTRGMKLVLGLPPFPPVALVKEHPDWRVDPDGSGGAHKRPAKEDDLGTRLGCNLGPWGDYLIDVCAELVQDYGVDGYSFDGNYHPSLCHCPACKAAYRAAGRDLPARANLDDVAYREYLVWRGERLEDHYRRMQQRLKKVNADAVLMSWTANAGRYGHLVDERCLAILSGHTERVSSVALSADGTTAVSGGADDTVRVWDIAAVRRAAADAGRADRVRGLELLGDDWAAVERQFGVPPHPEVISAAVSADGSRGVTGSGDHAVRLWDFSIAQCVATLREHAGKVTSVAVSSDAKVVVSVSWDSTLRVWDLVTGRCRCTIPWRHTDVMGVAESADGKVVVSVGGGGKQVLDPGTGEWLPEHPESSTQARSAVSSLQVPCECRVGHRDPFLEVLEPYTCTSPVVMPFTRDVIARFPGQFGAAACSPEGRYAIAGDGTGMVYLLRLRTRSD